MDGLPSPLDEQWLGRLQANGYRLSAPLRVIVKILAYSSRALSPVELFDLGRARYPRMGLVTVYRTLEKLEELGLVQRIHQENGCHMVLRSGNGHEHILLCVRCGQAHYFSGDDLTTLIAEISRQSGFMVQEHWLQLNGLCNKCQER